MAILFCRLLQLTLKLNELKPETKLECGPMCTVMAAQPNIGHWRPLQQFRNLTPYTALQSLADLAADVPCSNTANIGKSKT